MSLMGKWWRLRWSLYAPVYGLAAKPFESGRERAIERLDPQPGDDVLIVGCGTGEDFNHLPEGITVTAVDISPAMLGRAEERAEGLGLDADCRIADAADLPFDDGTFDAVTHHLILSVVPEPAVVMRETARVLRDDGRISIYDKFVPPGEKPSLLRRGLNPAAQFLFSSLIRRLDRIIDGTGLTLEDREKFLWGLYTVTVARPDGGG